MNYWTALLCASVLLVGGFVGCGPKPTTQPQETYINIQTFSGTLRNVHAVIGASPTGWELKISAGAGRTPEILPLDVSAVENDAKALDGQDVTIKVNGRNGDAYIVQTVRKNGP